jgi:hypothetical protein
MLGIWGCRRMADRETFWAGDHAHHMPLLWQLGQRLQFQFLPSNATFTNLPPDGLGHLGDVDHGGALGVCHSAGVLLEQHTSGQKA